jgi:hypothetical protein
MRMLVQFITLGYSNIGKSCLLEFATTGKRPKAGGSHTTAWYEPKSEIIPYYRKDFERVSNKMFGKIEPRFVDYMMRDAISASKKDIRSTYLTSCNADAGDSGAIIDNLDEAFVPIQLNIPDTGGQPKYEGVLKHVSYTFPDCRVYPCLVAKEFGVLELKQHPELEVFKFEKQLDDLKSKMSKIEGGLKDPQNQYAAYLQLQLDVDRGISEDEISQLKQVRDLPVHSVSAIKDNRYDILDIFVIYAVAPLVTSR